MTLKNSTFPLRLPHSLRAAVEDIAREDGTSMNQFVVTALAEKLSALKTAEFFEGSRRRANVAEFERIMNREGGQDPQPEDRL